MVLKYGITDRKPFVKLISEFLGVTSKYLFTPTYAFQIGEHYLVTRDGDLSIGEEADREEQEMLLEYLAEEGFVPNGVLEEQNVENEPEEKKEIERLEISIPDEGFSEQAISNLENLVKSKGSLIAKALGQTELAPVQIENGKIIFPWFENADAENIGAYTHLVAALGKMAKEQKRINAKEKAVDNEKYAFRCFLLRLGFIGDEFKADRKILMKNLSGSAAFKSGAKKGEKESCLE